MSITSFPIPTVPAAANLVSNTPTAPITATNVQTAIDQLADMIADLGVVNVKQFGATGDGVTDDTAAIQAAIDYARANNIKVVYIPNGIYVISSTIHLGPTVGANFSMTLLGAEGPGNNEFFGTTIKPTFNNTVAIRIEGGQGMEVKNLSVLGPNNGYRGNLHPSGVGIGVMNNGAGSRTRIENCEVTFFYTAYSTQATLTGALGDSNTFIKCIAFECRNGFHIPGTQNFINSFYDCGAACTNGIVTVDGAGAHVFGGNWSVTNSVAGVFTVGSISALSSTPNGNGFIWSFTAQVTAPDIFWPNVYNAFTFVTTHFGVVPCELTNWNAGTSTGTFRILYEWSTMTFGLTNIPAVTDFQNELQAATQVHAVEMVTIFAGYDLSVIGIHVENDFAPCILADTFIGFGGQRPSMIENVFFNTDPSFWFLQPSMAPSAANLARYYCAQTFPFIRIRAGDLTIRDSCMGVIDRVNVDFVGDGFLKIERCVAFNINLRNPQGTAAQLAQWNPLARYWSGAVLDNNYLFRCPSSVTGGADMYPDNWLSLNWGSSRFWGYRPAANEISNLLTTDLVTLLGTLPAISETSVPYPLMYGGQTYHLVGPGDYLGAQPTFSVMSTHRGWTYGQDLTTANIPGLSWSYKGQSAFVYCNHIGLIRGGMGVILNDGVDDILYIVTGVWPGLGFFTVAKAANLSGYAALSGLKTSVITGTTIGQEGFAIVQLAVAVAADVRLATQFDKTTTVLADIPTFTANLVVGQYYKFSARLFCTCPVAGGAKIQVGGTAGISFIHYGAKTYTAATLSVQDQATSTGVALGASTSAVDLIEVDGIVRCNPNPGNEGTFTLQFAQNVASGTSSVLTGSSFFVQGTR